MTKTNGHWTLSWNEILCDGRIYFSLLSLQFQSILAVRVKSQILSIPRICSFNNTTEVLIIPPARSSSLAIYLYVTLFDGMS
jgi:hypothetical protein